MTCTAISPQQRQGSGFVLQLASLLLAEYANACGLVHQVDGGLHLLTTCR